MFPTAYHAVSLALFFAGAIQPHSLEPECCMLHAGRLARDICTACYAVHSPQRDILAVHDAKGAALYRKN